MPQCPHCMSEIHEEALVCASCGAKKGILSGGMTRAEIKFRAAIVASVGLLILITALVFLIKGDGIVFVLLGVLSLIPFGLAAVVYRMSGSKEKWYR